MPMNKIIAWFRIIMLQSNPKSNKSTIFYLCFTRKSNLIRYTAICTAEISFIKRDNLFVTRRYLGVSQRNPCIRQEFLCHNSTMVLQIQDNGAVDTGNSREFSFVTHIKEDFLEELSFVTHIQVIHRDEFSLDREILHY